MILLLIVSYWLYFCIINIYNNWLNNVVLWFSGVTAGALLTVTSLPFKNIIGFLYISEDDKNIKISSINFWGKRVDRIVSADDWTPLFDMAPRKLDVLFLSPKLSDKTQYKWFVKFGKVLNAKKIGKVLE